jgi:hypothetical protein
MVQTRYKYRNEGAIFFSMLAMPSIDKDLLSLSIATVTE